MHTIKQIYHIALRECGILSHNPIYLFCMVIFPIIVVVFFTSLMSAGQPTDMPVGVVDLDGTATTRQLVRKLDAFQSTQVVARYDNVNEARTAIQRNQIYAFLYIPHGTTDGLMTGSQPKISFYYSNTSLTAGALLFRDLKTISTLGSASVGMKKLSAIGKTEDEIRTYLQPIAVDLHTINNPWVSYNVYLSNMLIPGCLMVFFFLITAYSLGTELKFNRAKELMQMGEGNIYLVLCGKFLPQTLIFLAITYGYMGYVFGVYGFPHPGGVVPMLLLGLLTVLASQCFGIFIFGLIPSMRMSMSVCSLWAVLSFSMVGAAFPAFAMSPALEMLANLFPLRHYYMIYQLCIFNDYPLLEAWPYILALIVFMGLPLFIIRRLYIVLLTYDYIS
uniref:ABC transporter permease n=1 Tax=Prevotella sp. GTC17259 TaxID=3236795 RepID=A0AB33J5D8_9BACT